MSITLVVVVLLGVTLVGLRAWHLLDARQAQHTWQGLRRAGAAPDATFDPGTVADLPEPARRYFLFTIRPGSAVLRSAEIHMGGQIGLGVRDAPNYLPMSAHQLLAPPHGLVWKLRAGRGALRIDGADTIAGQRSWTRMWLLGTLPIVRVGDNADHLRSAFGRMSAEAVFFAPGALLPGRGITWEAVSEDVARVTVVHDNLSQSVDITVAADGRPTMVVMSRWSDANPDRSYQLQPFGGYLSAFREFDGYTLPTRIEGGNFIGTDRYFPFYKADVTDVRFVDHTPAPTD